MMTVQRFEFVPETMPVAESHGGVGHIFGVRALGRRPLSSIRHVDQVVVPPGATIALHRHAMDNEELYIFLKGSGLMQSEGLEFEVKQGDVVVNPPGGEHGFRNTSSEDVWLAVVEVSIPEERALS